MEYLDFELKISPAMDGQYRVAVVRSPEGIGEPGGVMSLPPELGPGVFAAMAGESSRGERSREGGELSPSVYGRLLFDALLADDIRESYRLSLFKAEHEQKGLRIRLRIDPPELAVVPWEFLYDPKDDYGPLSLSRLSPVTRYLELAGASASLRIEPPLRILGMVASPADRPALDVESEKRTMEQAIDHLVERGVVQLTWLEGQTWRDLMGALRTGTWHVFHFIGHGGFDTELQEGLIELVGEDGNSAPLSASKLAALLRDHKHLRLVVLNSCEGSRASAGHLFSSTGAILLQKNIPSVVAMQDAITDEAAKEFARTFYDMLADGEPVDSSITEARIAMSMSDRLRDRSEWATPVLYMRSNDGKLFDFDVQAALFNQSRASPATDTQQPDPGRKGSAERAGIPTARARKGLHILLNKVQKYWIEGVLNNSIYRQSVIDLGMEYVNDAVEDLDPFGLMVDLAGEESRPLPAGQSISDVFHAEGSSLLILGDPGSGKTTVLLKLVDALIEQVDIEHSKIPVVFNLSSFNPTNTALSDWMVRVLSTHYQIPEAASRRWFDQGYILPLLDGLDEITAALRPSCVESINGFSKASSVGTVVCSRLKEYTDLPHRLALNRAVRLQQLKREEVLRYVRKGGAELSALHSLLERDSAMLIDARTPLMLSLMIQAYQGLSAGDLSHEGAETAEARRWQLMDAFTNRKFRRAEGGGG